MILRKRDSVLTSVHHYFKRMWILMGKVEWQIYSVEILELEQSITKEPLFFFFSQRKTISELPLHFLQEKKVYKYYNQVLICGYWGNLICKVKKIHESIHLNLSCKSSLFSLFFLVYLFGVIPISAQACSCLCATGLTPGSVWGPYAMLGLNPDFLHTMYCPVYCIVQPIQMPLNQSVLLVFSLIIYKSVDG